ncbi:MAG: lysophospholipid acyltransferase family protein [Thermodesulfobacteriota bacterium]
MATPYRTVYRSGRDRALVALLHGARGLLDAVGLERGLRTADRVAPLVPRVLRESRELSLEHLALALPELGRVEHERIVRAMFRGHARSVIEIAMMADVARRIDALVTIEGLEVMDEALAAGRGVVAITGHIGNWELLAAYFGLHGYPVTVIATPVKGERLNAENVALRARVGVETVLRDGPGASRQILRTLKAGRILAILMDQATRGQAVQVPFFGRPAWTPIGPALLAQRTGAHLVGVFIHRQGDGRHVISVRRPELPRAEGAAEAAWVEQATASLTALIEQEIRRRPDEWVWWHRRWRQTQKPARREVDAVENR